MKKSISEFYSNCTRRELEGFAEKLIDIVADHPMLNIYRGSMAIWTAAVVMVIARLNFLLDKSNENYMSVTSICDHFGANKTSVKNKATLIQNTYGISMFDSRLTLKEISSMLDFSVTKEGFIVPSPDSPLSIRSVGVAEGDDLADIDFFEEKLRYERKHNSGRPGAQKRKPGKQKPTDQLSLFDDE